MQCALLLYFTNDLHLTVATISGHYLVPITKVHTMSCLLTNKVLAILAMHMVKMLMASKVFIYQTHILSDFNGRGEKSAQVQYSLDFAGYGVPGLSWTTAYVYGWDIDTATDDNAKESELFNQVKYTVQSGFAKDASLRLRYSHYRNDDAYAN